MAQLTLQDLKDKTYTDYPLRDFTREGRKFESAINSAIQGKESWEAHRVGKLPYYSAKMFCAAELLIAKMAKDQMKMILERMPQPVLIVIETTGDENDEHGIEAIRATCLDFNTGAIVHDDYYRPRSGEVSTTEYNGISMYMLKGYPTFGQMPALDDPIISLKHILDRYYQGKEYTPLVWSRWQYDRVADIKNHALDPIDLMEIARHYYQNEYLSQFDTLKNQNLSNERLPDARSRAFQIRLICKNIADGMPKYIEPEIEVTVSNVNDFMMSAPSQGDDLDDFPF